MSLYNDYRPRDWDSVIGQEYITTILRNSITTGRVHHAYLFHGSRGTGKTTSARILAKALNCTNPKNGNPCHACANCLATDAETMLDIIEIDGASNNGVENVRELIEKARFEPNQGTYKIYIIDEVHMLSTGAFNALLKTLEQPPKHVKFILATTEIDKVPETIQSRSLRFDFRKISFDDIVARLTYVCDTEKMQAEPEALRIIAKSARGGLRDALTLLEQNIIDGEISTEHVRYTLSLLEDAMVVACIDALVAGDVRETQRLIEILREKHIEARNFFEQLMYALRDLMVEHIDTDIFATYSEIMGMLEGAYTRVRLLPDGMMLIELTLLRIVKRGTLSLSIPATLTVPKAEPQRTPPPKTADLPPKKELPKEEEKIILPDTEMSSKKIDTLPIEKTLTSNTPSFSYPVLIAKIKDIQPALTTDLKLARFGLDGTHLTLIFAKKWNYDRVNKPAIKSVITDTLSSLYGGSWELTCTLSEAAPGIESVVHDVF